MHTLYALSEVCGRSGETCKPRLAFGNAHGGIAIVAQPIASVFVSVEPLLETRKHGQIVRAFCLVGVARLELAALRSRTVRATKLRYTPIN